MSKAADQAPAEGAPAVTPFVSQGKAGFRSRWPDWMKQLPRLQFDSKPNPSYQLINPAALEQVLKNADPEAVKRIKEDITFLDSELMRLFRERDYEASLHQNRYRLVQILFMVLAAGATIIGALQGVMLNGQPDIVPVLALAETVVALLTTYLATISGRVPSLPLWLQNRRRAEHLRREYYRYLMNIAPYDTVSGYHRKLLLSTRAANINRGIYPDQQGDGGAG